KSATQAKKPVPALERVALLESGPSEVAAPAVQARAAGTRARAKDVPSAPVSTTPASPVSLVKPSTGTTGRRQRKDTGP
ncbi:hypothetical protein NK908_24745, partial [Salmonella enterica subsp. enterica serovar Typhimurium]|nr:hypothetical protein [Salmonella enterica subsp. enterica serovar Typhimurium]